MLGIDYNFSIINKLLLKMSFHLLTHTVFIKECYKFHQLKQKEKLKQLTKLKEKFKLQPHIAAHQVSTLPKKSYLMMMN